MKKEIKKLNLSKRTISNLNTVEMNQKVGAGTGPTGGQCFSNKCYTAHCTHGHACNGG